MRLFLDSSALAKRYVAEAGTDTVLARCLEADEIMLSIICLPELISAFNRLRRQKLVTQRQYSELKQQLGDDIAEATVLNITEHILEKTIYCLEQATVRTLDAIHIATAQESLCDLFISADQRQIQAAKKLGVEIEII